MAILLNFFDNVILQAITEEIVPKRGFFKDRYFHTGAGDIFKADEVLTEYRKGDRKLAAFVAPDVHDIPIARRGYEVHSYQPAYIAPSRVLTMGIEFVGVRIYATHMKLRKSTVGRLKREVKKITEMQHVPRNFGILNERLDATVCREIARINLFTFQKASRIFLIEGHPKAIFVLPKRL